MKESQKAINGALEALTELKDFLVEKSAGDERTISKPVHSVENDRYYDGMYVAIDAISAKIKELRAMQDDDKLLAGHWIVENRHSSYQSELKTCVCSKCGALALLKCDNSTFKYSTSSYCPNCGCRMIGKEGD